MRNGAWSVVALALAVASATIAAAQAPESSEEVPNLSYVAQPNIRTVQFGLAGLELSDPVVQLGGAEQLLLTFDVLEDELPEYRYSVQHLDSDWTPSQLTPIDYLSGFTEGDITEYVLSNTTVPPYTHFELLLPNQYVAWTKSGNYLLTVVDDNTGELAMQLRFSVFEPYANIDAVAVRPAQASLDKTHQEFDVAVPLTDLDLENPRRSLTLSVVQNGDWRTGLYGIEPRFLRNDQVVWDYQNRIVFPAMREWRSLDLRTLTSEGGRVAELVRDEVDGVSAFLHPEKSRVDFSPETRIDLNGKFVVEDFDNLSRLATDYVRTVFSLKVPRDESLEPIYLYGALTNYAFGEANRGVWNDATKSYTFGASLKQGFYDYAYVTPGPEGVRPVWTQTEGDWFQTENAYAFYLYYRPYGARYDRLVGYEYVQLNAR